MSKEELLSTVEKIAQRGKGILAADESTSTIKKRFDSIGVESTEENRRAYRDLLFTTPGIGSYICGVILYEETLYQKTSDGVLFTDYLGQQGVVPGIKVDLGLIPLANSQDEKTTQGLDGLPERLAKYKEAGAHFAKWRCVYDISDRKPSMQAIHTNAELLARYAAICQTAGIVPIVEPEVLINGDHTIERCAEVTERVLQHVFRSLTLQKVMLEGIILKPSMVIAGDHAAIQSTPHEVAEMTMMVLKRTVPAAVPTINFLSGGQTPEQATLHLSLMNKLGHLPWNVSFSYGRALQEHSLQSWRGKAQNVILAQQAFQKRMRLNSLAASGEYLASMEDEPILA